MPKKEDYYLQKYRESFLQWVKFLVIAQNNPSIYAI